MEGHEVHPPIIIGNHYILKLIYQVNNKIHGLSNGHYALATQWLLKGRANPIFFFNFKKENSEKYINKRWNILYIQMIG